MSRQRLLDKGGDLQVDALPHWKPVQLAENWKDVDGADGGLALWSRLYEQS